jgi:hypothetical protein
MAIGCSERKKVEDAASAAAAVDRPENRQQEGTAEAKPEEPPPALAPTKGQAPVPSPVRQPIATGPPTISAGSGPVKGPAKKGPPTLTVLRRGKIPEVLDCPGNLGCVAYWTDLDNDQVEELIVVYDDQGAELVSNVAIYEVNGRDFTEMPVRPGDIYTDSIDSVKIADRVTGGYRWVCVIDRCLAWDSSQWSAQPESTLGKTELSATPKAEKNKVSLTSADRVGAGEMAILATKISESKVHPQTASMIKAAFGQAEAECQETPQFIQLLNGDDTWVAATCNADAGVAWAVALMHPDDKIPRIGTGSTGGDGINLELLTLRKAGFGSLACMEYGRRNGERSWGEISCFALVPQGMAEVFRTIIQSELGSWQIRFWDMRPPMIETLKGGDTGRMVFNWNGEAFVENLDDISAGIKRGEYHPVGFDEPFVYKEERSAIFSIEHNGGLGLHDVTSPPSKDSLWAPSQSKSLRRIRPRDGNCSSSECTCTLRLFDIESDGTAEILVFWDDNQDIERAQVWKLGNNGYRCVWDQETWPEQRECDGCQTIPKFECDPDSCRLVRMGMVVL